MQQVIILRGLPGSGKSFWARELMEANPNKYKRVNKDLIREMIDSGKYTRDNEKIVLRMQDNLILDLLEEGFDVIVDNTNLAEKHIVRIKQLIGKKAEVVINDEFIHIPVEFCIKRDLNRANPVGEETIREMYENFIGKISKDSAGKIFTLRRRNKYPAPPEHDNNLPDCIIVDIDGTVAIHNERSPYEFKKCYTDSPNRPIVDLVHKYSRGLGVQESKKYGDKTWLYKSILPPKLIFMSGRDDSAYNMTVEWLERFGLDYDELFMRRTGDFRKDAILKEEMYKEHIEGKYNVLFVLDDRNQTVHKWRELGLTCLQVADGDF